MSEEIKTLNSDATSSTAPATEPAAIDSKVSDAKENSSSSSGSEGEAKKDDKKPRSLLDATKDAYKKPKSQPEPSTEAKQDQDKSAESDPAKVEQQKDGLTEEEKKKAEDERFDKHPRFQQLLKERDSLKGDATQYRQITDFMEKNSLNIQEVTEGFQIMAAMKNNPLKAREMLAKHVSALDEFAGEKLPQDLQEKVQKGLIDFESAKSVARDRNVFGHQRGLMQLNEKRMREAAVAQEHASMAQGITQSVNEWASQMKSRDPDYAQLEPFLVDKVRADGPARSPQEAVARAEKAYAELKRQFAPIRQVKPINPPTSSAASSSNNGQAKPRSVREAIALAAKN